jgi:outer membrane protein OmpA-like peptidoglycan-associated protein
LRDALSKTLKANTTSYLFDYLTVNVPGGTLAGVDFVVPVSHVRYNEAVFFAFDKAILEPSAKQAVSDFAKTILQDKGYRSILIVGHTDSLGTTEYNYNLSKNRAVTVAAELRALGVPARFMAVVPMGAVAAANN